MTIYLKEQISELSKRVAAKKYPQDCTRTKKHNWRCERILNRLTSMEAELRIKEGRYWNGK